MVHQATPSHTTPVVVAAPVVPLSVVGGFIGFLYCMVNKKLGFFVFFSFTSDAQRCRGLLFIGSQQQFAGVGDPPAGRGMGSTCWFETESDWVDCSNRLEIYRR